MWVCLCKGVTDHEINDLLTSPFINTVDDVAKACAAGTGCGGCRGEIQRLCDAAAASEPTPVALLATKRSAKSTLAG